MCHKIPKRYLTFEISLKMVHSELSKVYYMKMAVKIANLNLVSFTGYFLVINTLILTKVVVIFL